MTNKKSTYVDVQIAIDLESLDLLLHFLVEAKVVEDWMTPAELDSDRDDVCVLVWVESAEVFEGGVGAGVDVFEVVWTRFYLGLLFVLLGLGLEVQHTVFFDFQIALVIVLQVCRLGLLFGGFGSFLGSTSTSGSSVVLACLVV